MIGFYWLGISSLLRRIAAITRGLRWPCLTATTHNGLSSGGGPYAGKDQVHYSLSYVYSDAASRTRIVFCNVLPYLSNVSAR